MQMEQRHPRSFSCCLCSVPGAAWLLAQTGRLELVWLSFPIAELMSLLMSTIFMKKTMRMANARMAAAQVRK